MKLRPHTDIAVLEKSFPVFLDKYGAKQLKSMGMTKELPLHMMANNIRVARIYEGPSEVHRVLIARYALQGRHVQL